MKILDNNIVREMTDEEVAEFISLSDGYTEPLSELEIKAKAYDILMGEEM